MLSLAAAALALYDSSKPKEGDVYYATVKNFHSVVLSQPGAVAVQFFERFVYIDGDTKVASGEVAYTFAALKRGDADLLAVREMEASNSRRALSPPGQHVDIFNTGLLGFRRTPAVRWRKFARDSAAIL